MTMMMKISTNFQHRRRRAALLVVLVGTAALSLQALLVGRYVVGDGGGGAPQLLSSAEEMEAEDQLHRILIPMVADKVGSEDVEILAIPGEDALSRMSGERAVEPSSAATATAASHAQRIDANQPLPPYTIEDAIKSSKAYSHNFALLVYDPDDDAFYGMYSKRHFWRTGCAKLLNSIKYLTYFLRTIFPERFQGKASEELVIPISSGDSPGISNICINHFLQDWSQEPPNPLIPQEWKEVIASGVDCSHHTAPILNFGSAFRHPRMFPNIIAMPMPEGHHLYCFQAWAAHKAVCKKMRDLEFGEEGVAWEDLIPQVVWRGTDFPFLTKVEPLLDKPKFEEGLTSWPFRQTGKDQKATKVGGQTVFFAARKKRRLERVRRRAPKRAEYHEQLLARFAKAAAVESMKERYYWLSPRWKAVVLTAEAESDATADSLPWANMKFSTHIRSGEKAGTRGAEEYQDWEDIGMATGAYMSSLSQSKYRYHIDLGGGGGTTWTGTIQKLAMPGLLFHHLTPTKDYIHDWMEPWVHYVPVSSDLLDLKQKFDWAESHPAEAKKIAYEGSKLMRYLTSNEGYEHMFRRSIVEPLRRVIEAYRPVSTTQLSSGTWREAAQKIEGDDVLFSVSKCSGFWTNSCTETMRRKKRIKTPSH